MSSLFLDSEVVLKEMSYPNGGYILNVCPLLITPKDIRDKYKQKSLELFGSEHKSNLHKDSGFDLYTPSDRSGNIMPIKIEPGETKLVGLGVKCALYEIGIGPHNKKCLYPKPYYLYARSSISKKGLIVANSVGIIDSGYRGELKAALHNVTNESVFIQPGDRLMQICMPNLSTDFVVKVVDKLDETKRGTGGIGSTGN